MYNPKFMLRAIRVAEKARAKCSPNPFVGAIVVKDQEIIAEGWTQEYGADHAEVQALKKAGARARNADIYVSLEPCAHFGKTPPCAEAIVEAGIKKAYIGIIDPNPLVAGKGIEIMRKAGLEVQYGFFAEEISKQLEYFLCRQINGRPFVIWKAALSLDGKYAARDGSSRWISSDKSRTYVHKLRAQIDVVLTGLTTIEKDDPLLNCRKGKNAHQPIRVVLDAALGIPLGARIVQTARDFPLLIFCDQTSLRTEKAIDLLGYGAKLFAVPTKAEYCDLTAVLHVLHELGYYSVLLEAGSTLSSAFIRERLIDKVMIFQAPMLIGGDKFMLSDIGINNISESIRLRSLEYKHLGEDILWTGYPKE